MITVAPRQSPRQSFTLIELLVTMTVIVILAGITLAAVSGVQSAAARNRAVAEIAALNAALESYKVDNGIYPYKSGAPNPSSSYSPTAYVDISKFLYEELVWNSDDGVKGYFKPKESMLNGKPLQADTYIVDPWGYAYGYMPMNPGTTNTPTFNVGFFDLWSTGGGTAAKNTNSWIVNWPDANRKSVN